MRIALVDSNPKDTVYPLALMKLGAWQQSLGNKCSQIFKNKLPKNGEYDEIWITTLFTFDIHHAARMAREATTRAKVVKVGGVSASLLPHHFQMEDVEVIRGLVPEAEKFSPNYDLLWETPKYSISHTSRGCVRKCKFCMVPKLEPIFGTRAGWETDLYPGAKKVLFFDNNWLAKNLDDLTTDVTRLKKLAKEKIITEIDFNQGLDARLVTPEIADLLEGLPLKPVRFAFDGMHEDKYYQKAIRLMAARGFKTFRSYVLFNFMDKPSDFYYRLRVGVELEMELRQTLQFVKVESFPMRFQPILDVDKQRNYVGKFWTKKGKAGFFSILGKFSQFGQISCNGGPGFTSLEEFEYWFGKNDKEFERLINYPKIRELSHRKKGLMRIKRVRGEAFSLGQTAP